MQLKKGSALLLILAILLAMMPLSSLAADVPEFPDMPDDWSTAALRHAVLNGLLFGDNGMIRPNDPLTRAQMAAVVNRAFGAAQKAPLNDFNDVSAGAWYFDDMAKAVKMGTFEGSGDGLLLPDKSITREEAFAVLARAFKLPAADEGILDQFSDKDDISAWAKGYVSALVSSNYIAGHNGKLNPGADITRAEFAQLMDNFVKQYINRSGTYTEIAPGNIMVNAAGVTLKDTEVKGDLIIGDGVGDGNVTLENVDVAGRMVVRGGGVNSIVIKGGSHIDAIIIARVDGQVRIYTEDGIEVGTVVADGSDDVILEGSFTSIIITADDIAVTAKNAVVENVDIQGDHSVFVVRSDSSVEKITVTGNNASITGDGKVDTVFAYASGITVETINTAVTAGSGSADVNAAGIIVGLGETVVTKKETTPPVSSGDPPVIDPSVAEANSFTANHAAVLSLTADTVQISDETAVADALAAYAALSEAAKTRLTAEKTLLDHLDTKIDELIQAAADHEAADQVIGLIAALPAAGELALTDKTDVTAARNAYDGLTADQKALVTNLAALTAAEARIAELEAQASDNYDRSWPIMAYDSENNRYLMIFFKHDPVLGSYNLCGRLVDTGGAYIGSEFPVRASTDVGSDYNFKPDIAYDSANGAFLVVWNESALTGSNLYWDVYGQKLGADGSAIGEPFAISDPNDNRTQKAPFAAFDHVNNRFFVTYRNHISDNPSQDDIHGRFVNIGGETPVVGEDIVVYHDDLYSQSVDDIAFNGTDKFMIPVRTYRNTYLMAVDAATGTVSQGLSFGSTAHGVSLSYDDTHHQFLAVWASGVLIYGRYVGQDGLAGDTAFSISNAFDGQGYVSASCADGTFYVAWEDEQYYSDYDSYINIAAKKVDAATGTLSDQINITEGSNQAQAPFICAGNSGALAAWTSEQDETPDVIGLYHMSGPASAANFVSAPQAADITIPADITVHLSVDQAAAGYYAVVQEDRSGYETPAPTAEQLKQLVSSEGGWVDHYGVVPVLAAGSQLLSGLPEGEQIVIPTANGFKAMRTYTVYFVLETDTGVFSEVAGATFNTLADTNPPVFNQSGNGTGVWSCNARSLIITEKTIDCDENYDLFIWVAEAADAPQDTPAAADVIANGRAYREMFSGIEHHITYTGLEPGTEYHVYMVAQDYSGEIEGLCSEVLVESATTPVDTEGPDKAGISDDDCYVFRHDSTGGILTRNKYMVIQFNELLYAGDAPEFLAGLASEIRVFDYTSEQTLTSRGDTVEITGDTLIITFNTPPAEGFDLYINPGALQDTNDPRNSNTYEISIRANNVPDITPAGFETTYPKEYASGISQTSIAAEVKFNEAAAVFWVLLPMDAAAPEYDGSIADNTVPGKISNGSMSLDELEPALITITGLTAGTGYDLWFTAIDANGNYMPKQKITLMTTAE